MIGFSFAGHPVALPLLEMTVAQTFSIFTIWGKKQKGHHSGHPVALPLLEMTVAQTFSIFTIWGKKQKGHHSGHPVALPLLEMTVAQTFSIFTIWGKNQKGHHSRRSDRRRYRCCASVFVTLLVGNSYFSFDPFGFIKASRLHHQGH